MLYGYVINFCDNVKIWRYDSFGHFAKFKCPPTFTLYRILFEFHAYGNPKTVHASWTLIKYD